MDCATLSEHLLALLRGGDAHLGFDEAIEGFPPALRGLKVPGVPYSAW